MSLHGRPHRFDMLDRAASQMFFFYRDKQQLFPNKLTLWKRRLLMHDCHVVYSNSPDPTLATLPFFNTEPCRSGTELKYRYSQLIWVILYIVYYTSLTRATISKEPSQEWIFVWISTFLCREL